MDPIDDTNTINGNSENGGTAGQSNQNNFDAAPSPSPLPEQGETKIEGGDQLCDEAPEDEENGSNISPDQGETKEDSINEPSHESPNKGVKGHTRNSDKRGTPGRGNPSGIVHDSPSPP